jgi:hypothetical protein
VPDRHAPGTGEPAGGLLFGQLLAVVEADYWFARHLDDSMRRELVRVAMRRWRSFARRSSHPGRATPAKRVNDLAKGLRDRFEPKPELALMWEYRDLAARLAAVLADPPAG